jgi:hypothetical protein
MDSWINDPGFCRWYTVMAKAMHQAPPGLVLEFGCGECRTTRQLAEMAYPNMVHGFDSFTGLPEDWTFQSGRPFMPKGSNLFTRPTDLPDNIRIWPGLFADTVPGMLAWNVGRVGFLHIDCDLYSSTTYVLDALADRLDDAVIAFDECDGHQVYRENEYRAFIEFQRKHGFTATPLGKQHSDGMVFQVSKK